MPQGKGTYGTQKGRPPKKGTKKWLNVKQQLERPPTEWQLSPVSVQKVRLLPGLQTLKVESQILLKQKQTVLLEP